MNTGMTEDHRVQLQQIQQRDKELDERYLDQIERGVEDLRDIALRANEVMTEGGRESRH
jgi:phage-related protein